MGIEKEKMGLREILVKELQLLATPSEQLAYESNVPIANVPSELICSFCDDLFHPKAKEMISAFSNDELKGLAHLYGVLCEASRAVSEGKVNSVSELLKLESWLVVIKVAQDQLATLTKNSSEPFQK